MIPERLMCAGSSEMIFRLAKQSFHVRRIKHDAINRAIRVRQLATIRAGLNVAGQQTITKNVRLPPKGSLPVCDIGDSGTERDVQVKDLREHFRIASDMSADNDLAGSNTASDALLFHLRLFPFLISRCM